MEDKKFTERRRFARVPREFVVNCKELTMSEDVPEEVRSKLVNISASGILFESTRSYDKDIPLKLELMIQRWEKFSSEFIKFDQTAISKPFVALGRVARVETVEEGKFLLGVELNNVDPVHREALKRYLEHLIETGEGR